MKLAAAILFLFNIWGTASEATTRLKISIHDANANTIIYQAMMDFVKLSLKRENIEVDYRPLPLERASQLVNDGELDGELVRIKLNRKDFENILESSFPLFYVRYVLVQRAGDKIDKSNISSLRGVIPLNSHGLEPFLSENKISVVQVASLEAGIKMVTEKRADFIVMSDLVFMGFKKKDPSIDLDVSKNFVLKLPMYFRLNRKHRSLMPKIEAAFKKEKDSNPTKYGPYKDYFGF